MSEVNKDCKECGRWVEDTHEGVPFIDGTALCMECFEEDYKHIGQQVMDAMKRGGLFDEEVETSDEQWFDDPEWIDMNRGEPFDVAWDSIEKEWSPNWREQAESLEPIYARKITNYPKMGYEELGLPYDEDTNKIESGMTMTTFEHPFDSRFMIKDPRGLTSNWKEKRHQHVYDGKMMDQVLEELGYPIASEYDAGDYAIQPKLTELENYNESPENQKIANDWVMRHVVGDRSSGYSGTRNWGQDQLGNWRLFDAEMRLSNPNDWMYDPIHYRTQKIDLPANRLLNFMDEHEIGHGMMGVDPPETVAFKELRSWLERFEPYSDNPKYVELDGKAKWMEGY